MLAVEQLAGQVAGADLAGLSQYGTATTRKTYSTTEELLAQSALRTTPKWVRGCRKLSPSHAVSMLA